MVFEFRPFDADGKQLESVFRTMGSDSAAKSAAGTLCKKINGPVDIAYDDGSEWSDRYITTVAPSEFHAKGYYFERLDG